MKHTKGPWAVWEWRKDHKTAKGEYQPRYSYSVSTLDGSPIEATTKNKANAHLIAAAPDMLEALLSIQKWLKNNNHNPACDDLIEDAIKKAKGE